MKVLAALGTAFASVVLACTLHAGGDPVQPERTAAAPQTPPPKPTLPKGTPGEQVAALIKHHEKAMTAFRKQYEAAKTEEELERLEAFYPDPDPYARLLLQIVEQSPKDPAAVEALLWVVRNGSASRGDAESPYAKAKSLSEFCLRRHAWCVSGGGMEPQTARRCVDGRRVGVKVSPDPRGFVGTDRSRDPNLQIQL